MGPIRVHKFTSLHGVIENPTSTFDFGFDPAMGQDIGNPMSSCGAILPVTRGAGPRLFPDSL